MKVNFIPFNQQQKYNQSFKSNITIDIGGSQREGSCKVYYASTSKDEEFYSEQKTVNDLGKDRFENDKEFVQQIVNKIKRVQDASRPIVELKGYEQKENSLQNVAIFLPSYTNGDYAFYLPNLRNDMDKPLKDLDFTNFKERLAAAGVEVSEDMHFKLLQDAMGTGLATAKRLYENGMLEEGNLYTACITGGGCGIANIEAVDKNSIIIKSSGSSYLSQGLNLQKVSKAGASAPALIENFCRAMGFNDEIISDLKSCHKAEFVLSDEVTYQKDPRTEKLKGFLADTKIFDIVDENEKEYTVKLKEEYAEKYDKARRNAIDKYCLALASFAIIKKNEGSNGMIVTGKLAKAINETALKKYKNGLGDWVMQHLMQSFNSYELDKLQDVYDFKVLCDERFFIENNTECGELVHLARFIGNKRFNWLKLDVESLRQLAKKKGTMILK